MRRGKGRKDRAERNICPLSLFVQGKGLPYDNRLIEKTFENGCLILNEMDSKISLRDATV